MPTVHAALEDHPVTILRLALSTALLVLSLLLSLAGTAQAQGLGGSGVLALDGVDDYAQGPDTAAYDVGIGATDDFTLETRFHVSNVTTARNGNLFFKNLSYGVYILFNVNGDEDRIIYRLYTVGSSYVYTYYNVTLPDGWHHLAAVFDNENTESSDLFAIYLDGNLVASSTAVDWTPGVPNSSSALNVGGYQGINSYPGWLEETRISKTVRYSGGSYVVLTAPFSTDSDTMALWHFNEAPGSATFLDSSGGGNSLTGQNGAATHGDDMTGPVIASLASSTHPDSDTWYANDSPSFAWSATDNLSGVADYSYVLDHSPSTTPDMVSEGGGGTTSYADLADGEWYFHVRARDGAGNWGAARHLRVRVGQSSEITLSAPTETLAYGAAAAFSATIAGAGGPLEGRTDLTLWTRLVGSTTWSQVATMTWDGSGGRYLAARTVTAKADFQARLGGAGDDEQTQSSIARVNVKAYVSNPVAPLKMSRTKNYTVYGYLKSRHAAGTYPVRIYKYRSVSGHWKSYGYVTAKASNYSTYTKYSRSVRLPYAGRWRLRAYAPADSGHVATWSRGYDYVTVK